MNMFGNENLDFTFLHTGKPALSPVLVETSYCDKFYVLYVPNFMKSWVTVQIEYFCWRRRK